MKTISKILIIMIGGLTTLISSAQISTTNNFGGGTDYVGWDGTPLGGMLCEGFVRGSFRLHVFLFA